MSRSRRTRSPTGGCVTNSAAIPAPERIDREERLGRRAAAELDELGRLLQPDECVREPVRGAAEPGREPVGFELPLRREQEVHAG